MIALDDVAPARAAENNGLKRPQLARLARAATCALHDELILFPKPGLVSLRDNGSHQDMAASTFMRSLFALRHYFLRITEAGARKAGFPSLVGLGICAEDAMMRATNGINTHRGAIFSLGLLSAAAGDLTQHGQPLTPQAIRNQLLAQWGGDLRARCHTGSHSKGSQAARQFGLRGASEEAALGFPVLFEVTLPSLQKALAQGLPMQAAQLQALFHTIASLDDTNLANRGGLQGLRWAQAQAQKFLLKGGMGQDNGWEQARAMHTAFMERRLSPGGSADLLACACWVMRIGEAP